MSKHSTTEQVDTLAFTDDTARPVDELVIAIYHAARVNLKEATTMADQLINIYELTHKTEDVTVNRDDIDAHAFEAMLAGLAKVRDHNNHF